MTSDGGVWLSRMKPPAVDRADVLGCVSAAWCAVASVRAHAVRWLGVVAVTELAVSAREDTQW